VFAIALVATALACALSTALLARAPRLLLLRWATAAASLVLAVLLAELPALFGLVDYNRVFAVASGEWSGPATSFVGDPVLAWARPPHSRWSGQPRSDMAVAFNLPARAPHPQSFTTDARGFRNRRELSRADVALVGDSFVEGAYVSDEETAAEDLERLTGWSVLNLGRSGYGTLQELEVLKRHALPLGPRAVAWFFFEGNDLYDDETYENALVYLRAHGGEYQAPWLRAPDLRRFREASLSVNAFRLLRRAFDPLIPVAAPSYGVFRVSGQPPRKLYFYRDATLRFDEFEERRLARTEDALREGALLLRERSVSLLLVFVPSKFRVYSERCEFPEGSPCASWRLWDLEARFQRLCDREGLTLLDLTGPMRAAAASGRLLYAPEDSHWNAQGHQFVAELLADRLGDRSTPR
jgi:lysophospholipase L1-like esterase